MTKTKVTRHAVAMSFLSLMLCVSMLLGTTFAWFTDSVTSAGNIIKSGTLDVEMYYADGTEAVPTAYTGEGAWKDASTGAIFNYDLWEPGYTEVRHIQIKNVGTLALKYKVQIVANGTVSELADVIDVYYMDPAEQVASRSALAAKTPMGTLKAALDGMDTTAAGNLLAGQAHTITIALKMQEEAGNEYQNKSIGTDFSIQLIATQLTSEVDSFDKLYDETSVFPVLSVAKTNKISTSTTTEDLTIAKTGEIKSATVPAAAANTLFDSMKDDEAESNELTLTLNVAKTGETTTSAGTTVALEIDMTAVMESTKAGVTSTTTDNVTTFSNYITIEYNLGAGLSGVTATHKGNAMVNSTDTADDAGHGIYSYNAENGILTIKTLTLSPFAVTYRMEGDGAAVALTSENTEASGDYLFANGDIILTAPINGGTASVKIKDSTRLDPAATELKLTIEKAETVTLGRDTTAYTFNVSGLGSYASFAIIAFPCAFDKEAGDELYLKNQYNEMNVTSFVGSQISYADGAFGYDYAQSGLTFAIAKADPAEAQMVDLKDIQDVLSVDGTTIQANDTNAKGTAVKSTGASITANNFTLKDLKVLAETTTNGGLYVEGNGTTIDNADFESRWLGSYGDAIKIKGSDTTIKDTTISHYQTASSSDGRYAGLELHTDTAASVTTIDNVTFKGMNGLLFRQFGGRINITNSTFDVSDRAFTLNVDSGPNTGSAEIKNSTIKAKSIGFMRVRNGVTFENTTFATPNGTGNFTINTGDNVTTNILFKDCTFNNELTFPASTTTGFKTVLTFDNCTYLGQEITADNIQSLFNFTIYLTTYHVEKAYDGTTVTITAAQN